MMTTFEFAKSLRLIAKWYEKHPDAPVDSAPYLNVSSGCVDVGTAARVVRMLGCCDKDYGESLVTLTRNFGGVDLRFLFWRSAVCERKVVGTMTVPQRVVPAYTREIVEWDCHPLLEPSGDSLEAASATEPQP